VHIGPTAFIGVGVNDAAGGAGAVIRQVIPNGPAAGAGFAPGDVINSINGQPVNSATALTAILDQHHPGDNVQVGVAGRSASVTLADGPPG
jgi:S1-C subfamily serine protease